MRTITLKPTSQSHKEAVQAVASVLNARTHANMAISEGLATSGMRAAFSSEIARKAKAAQPSLKAARAEDRAAKDASRARITARVQSFYSDYSYLTKTQVAALNAGWAGR